MDACRASWIFAESGGVCGARSHSWRSVASAFAGPETWSTNAHIAQLSCQDPVQRTRPLLIRSLLEYGFVQPVLSIVLLPDHRCREPYLQQSLEQPYTHNTADS